MLGGVPAGADARGNAVPLPIGRLMIHMVQVARSSGSRMQAKDNGGYEGLIRTVQIGLPPEVDDVQYVFDVKKIEQTAQDRQVSALYRRHLLEWPDPA